MKNLLVFAHRKEAETFFENYDFKRVDFLFDNFFESQNFYLVIAGEGIQNTTEKLSALIASHSSTINSIYNLGVAGALNSKLKRMDVVEIRTSYAYPYKDVEFKSFNTKSDSTFDCISTNTRILTKNYKEKLAFYADIVDRELWAIGSVSHLFKKNFTSIKIISDEINDEDFCQTIINDSKLYADKLFQYFQIKFNQEAITPPKKEHSIYQNKNFHFSVTQKRQYENLLSLLSTKTNEETLFASDFFKELSLKEIASKQRSKELLAHLILLLNPHHKRYFEKLNSLISKVTKNGIEVSFDQNLEDNNLEIFFKTNNAADLNHKISLISTLPIDEIQKVFTGDLDV